MPSAPPSPQTFLWSLLAWYIYKQRNFEALVEALKRADFSPAEIDELLQVLAGLLHLSNVSFAEGQDELLEIQDTAAKEALTRAASLLGLEVGELQELLRCRRMVLKGDILFTRRSQQQSISTCCSLIKFIYSRLFDHIVERLNENVARQLQQHGQHEQEGSTGHKSIGSKYLPWRFA